MDQSDMKGNVVQEIVAARYKQNGQILNLTNLRQHWAAILRHRDWSMVKILSLGNCGITDKSIRLLFKFTWPQLTALNLQNKRLTYSGVSELSQKPWPKLQKLWLDANNISDDGLSLVISKFTNSETLLSLDQCGLTSRVIQSIIGNKLLGIKYLDLNSNLIGNHGTKLLTKANLINLERLFLNNCHIECEGFKHLTKADWPNLNKIQLKWIPMQYSYERLPYENAISLNGWEMMQQANWKKLTSVSICQKFSIGWVKCVLIDTQPESEGLIIKNNQELKSIHEILSLKNFYVERF